MKRKLLTQLIIFFLLLFTYQQFISLKYITTKGSLTGDFPVFTTMQIEMLKSNNHNLADDALKETINILLDYINPDLNDYFWQGHYVFLNLIPGDEDELVISITLPPDRGIITVLKKQNNRYVLINYSDNCLPITKLDVLEGIDNNNILLTEEKHNERLGCFSETTYIKLWGWCNKDLSLLWQEYSFWEINWLNTWENPEIKPIKWVKLIQNATISYNNNHQIPKISVEVKQYHYEAKSDSKTLPEDSLFDLKDSRLIKDNYYWSEDFNKFIMLTKNNVAILKDMEHHLESFVSANKYYQVINKQNQVKLIKKSDIDN